MENDDNIVKLEKMLRAQPCERKSLAKSFGYDQGSIDYWVGCLKEEGVDVHRYDRNGRVYYRIKPDEWLTEYLDQCG